MKQNICFFFLYRNMLFNVKIWKSKAFNFLLAFERADTYIYSINFIHLVQIKWSFIFILFFWKFHKCRDSSSSFTCNIIFIMNSGYLYGMLRGGFLGFLAPFPWATTLQNNVNVMQNFCESFFAKIEPTAAAIYIKFLMMVKVIMKQKSINWTLNNFEQVLDFSLCSTCPLS